ncbi:MAG: spore coat U domain-containing protein [Rhodoferax sp.]|nr:spore coat U domain-containing protein [Rhodoferax sp.]
MKFFSFIRRLWLLALLPGCLLLAPGPAHAIAVGCSSSATTINFGTISGLATGATSTGTINWTCTASGNSGSTAYITLCLNIGAGSGGTSGSTRTMSGGTPALQFQLYQNSANTQIWGSLLSGPNPTPYQTNFLIVGNGTYNGSATVYGTIAAGQSTVTPGSYTSSFSAANSVATGSINVGGSTYPGSCPSADSGIYFPFTVMATVIKQCQVTAGATSNINLGTVPSTATNTSGTNNISVSCTSTTPYYIGLSPNSTASTTGAGTMSGTIGGNTDKVPYQLYSNAGLSAVWGNTATSTSVGNGVSGTGTGLAQSIPVWAKAPSANYTPDSYSDTVTVNVNY